MTGDPVRRRWWRTMRVRITAIASLALTAALVVGVSLLYVLQIDSVRRALDGQLSTYATQISQLAPAGNWPTVLPPSTLDSNAVAQVIAADGHVLAATRTLAGLPPVYVLPPGSSTPVRQKAAAGVIAGEVRVIAVRQTISGRSVTIVTITPTELLTQLRASFSGDLLIALPIILLGTAGAVWLVVGRALRPVERIRQAVTDITSADLSRRVPEPGTPDEVGNLAVTMNDMLERLDTAARRQRRFVADASHELRSPLAAIRTTLEVGLAHPDRAPWPTIAERTAQQSNRLEGLVEELLVLARSDERILTAAREPVDIAGLLRDITSIPPTRDIDVRLAVTGTPVTSGNTDHLTRLVRNIVDNAVRHATSTVEIAARTSDEHVVISVTDDGPGIPKADRDRIFDRFVRLDTSRDRSSGTTGLGLAIARELATTHQGTITVTDNPDGGARFLIRLPARSVPDSTEAP